MNNSDGRSKFEDLSQEEQLSLIRALQANLANVEATAALLRARKKGNQTYVDAPTDELIAELRQNLLDTANLASFMVCGGPSFVEVPPGDFPPSDPTLN